MRYTARPSAALATPPFSSTVWWRLLRAGSSRHARTQAWWLTAVANTSLYTERERKEDAARHDALSSSANHHSFSSWTVDGPAGWALTANWCICQPCSPAFPTLPHTPPRATQAPPHTPTPHPSTFPHLRCCCGCGLVERFSRSFIWVDGRRLRK